MKITEAGATVPLSLLLDTGNHQRFQYIANRLGAAVECLRGGTARLSVGDDDMPQWIAEALVDDAPLAFEQAEPPPASLAVPNAELSVPTEQQVVDT